MNEENAPDGPKLQRPHAAGLLVLLIGIAIGYYLGSQVWPAEKPKIIRIAFDPIGNLTVRAKKGTQLEWYTAQNGPAGVKFKFGQMPCTNAGGPASGKCTMKDDGTYLYNCIDATVCSDPGVGGGDDAAPVLQTTGVGASDYLQPPYATPKQVNLYCDSSSNVSMADSPVHGKQGTAFFMNLVGTTFTATFPAGVCDTADPHNPGNPNCRITAAYNPNNPQSNVYTYNITVNSCTLGHSTVTVDPPTP
jgi:hypothetical protein